MFHWRDGWYFSRTGANMVVIEHHVYGAEKNELGQLMYTIDVKIAIPGAEWASIIASVSATGETSESYFKAVAFHNGNVYTPQFEQEHSEMIDQLNNGTYPHDLNAKGE